MNNLLNFRYQAIYYWIFFTAAIVYIITAYNTPGYYGTDEHFHIIEFAKVKLGINQVADMPWGYSERFRSSIQPIIYLLIFKFANFVNITDPYTVGFLLQLLSAFFALYVIHYFIINTRHLIQSKNARIAYYLLSYFTWFIPFISVRFSAETWSGLFFLYALAIYFNPDIRIKKYFLIGCVLGLSFIFRFQMAFSASGLILWLIIFDKPSLKKIGSLIVGSLLILLLENILDCWFYETPVFTLWNYFYAFFDNTVNYGSSRFGTSPWYTYIEVLFRSPGHFLGATFILAIIVLIIKQPKNIFIWSFLPFFIIHSFIAHKEERFMFPLIYLFPIILIMAYEVIIPYLNRSLLYINYVFIGFLLIINFVGLIFLGTSYAGNGKIVIIKHIHDHYGEKPVNIIQSSWSDVYDKHGNNIIPYREKKMNLKAIGNLCDLTDSLLIPDIENFLIIQKRSLELKSCAASISENHFVLEKQSIPPWFEWVNNNFYNGFDGLDVYILYRKEK